jgi:hypothetical protein
MVFAAEAIAAAVSVAGEVVLRAAAGARLMAKELSHHITGSSVSGSTSVPMGISRWPVNMSA